MIKENFSTWTERDPDDKLNISANRIDWISADRSVGYRVYKDFGEDCFGDFEHRFAAGFSKIVTKSEKNRLIIIFWECLNNPANRIYTYAQQVGKNNDKWTLVVAQKKNGKNLWVFNGDYQFDIDKKYYFTIIRRDTLCQVKVFTDYDRINIVEDSGKHNCVKDKYRYLWVTTIGKTKVDPDDWSTGYIENLELYEIGEKKLPINSITIQNYRPLGDIILDKITPITVFVGRNNTGKSAILEAIALASTAIYGWYDSLGKDIIEPIIEKRGGVKHANMMIKLNEHDVKINIEGKYMDGILTLSKNIDSLSDENSSNLALDIKNDIDRIYTRHGRRRRTLRTTNGMREEYVEDKEMLDNLNLLKDNIWNYFEIFIEYKDKLSLETTYAALLSENYQKTLYSITSGRIIGITNIYRSPKKEKSNTIFLLTTSLEYLRELQRRLAINGELLNVINVIRNKILYFEDIRQIDNDYLIFLKGINRPFPISSMGDGFKAQLSIISALATVKEGVVIMEEPEIRLHPGYMSSVATEIVNTSSLGNIQYFISTHSLEFLNFLLRENEKLINVVRMYRDDISGEIDYEILTGKVAIEELDRLKLDLRGV